MTAAPVRVRAFFALWPPGDVLTELVSALASIRAEAPPHVRWQPPERLHLTLLFLGDCGPGRLRRARAAGSAAAGAATAAPVGFDGAGHFGPVLWLGVSGDWLAALRSDLSGRLGVPATRPFRPHLTVARSRGAAPDPDVVRRLDRVTASAWRPEALTLVSSIVGPAPAYEVLDRYPL